MKNINTLGKRARRFHERAMIMAETADLIRLRRAEPKRVKMLYRQAHRFESKAARIALSLRAFPDYQIFLGSAQSIWQNFLDCSS